VILLFVSLSFTDDNATATCVDVAGAVAVAVAVAVDATDARGLDVRSSLAPVSPTLASNGVATLS